MRPADRILLILFLLNTGTLFSQELYVFSEPASNMPANSISAKLTGRFPDSKENNYFKQRYMPEVMFGINKNWMVHLSGTFSDYYTPSLRPESIRSYIKYRFLSQDDVHRHFRMAAFVEGSYSRNDMLYDEHNLEGDNSGLMGGIIATQLVNKFAVSGTVGYMKIFEKTQEGHAHDEHALQQINYSLSAGLLLLPRVYTDYHQTNLNLYVELLGMQGFETGHYNLDLAPAIQLIFNSNTKLNLGAKFQLEGNMVRVGERMYQVSVEHAFLNALRKKKVGNRE